MEFNLKRIYHERVRRGLSQRTVAERIGVGYDCYSKCERGVYVPKAGSPLGNRLERFFGLTLRTLLKTI